VRRSSAQLPGAVSQFCYNQLVDGGRLRWLPEARGGACPAANAGTGRPAERGVLKLEALVPRWGIRIPVTCPAPQGCESYARAAAAVPGALYRRVGGDVFVLAAIAPEAEVDRRRFDKAVQVATSRLSGMEES
jgi:hypothetical protein